jgi:hypothetical protein
MKKILPIATLIIMTIFIIENRKCVAMKIINPSMNFRINQSNLQILKNNAFDDEGENAFRIYQHYNFATHNLMKANRWLFICTLFGNKVAINNFRIISQKKNLSLKKIFKLKNEEIKELEEKKKLYSYFFLFCHYLYCDNDKSKIYFDELINSSFPFKRKLQSFMKNSGVKF